MININRRTHLFFGISLIFTLMSSFTIAGAREDSKVTYRPKKDDFLSTTDTRDISFHPDFCRAAKKGHNSAVYGQLKNRSTSQEFHVISASTDVAKIVELHTVNHRIENGQDIKMMRPVKSIAINPKSITELKEGGLHIMLINLTQDLSDGDIIPLTLKVKNKENTSTVQTIVTNVPVKSCCGGCH